MTMSDGIGKMAEGRGGDDERGEGRDEIDLLEEEEKWKEGGSREDSGANDTGVMRQRRGAFEGADWRKEKKREMENLGSMDGWLDGWVDGK